MNEEKKFYVSDYNCDDGGSPMVFIDPSSISYIRECGHATKEGRYRKCAIGAGGREFVVDDYLQIVMESIYGLDSSKLYTIEDCVRRQFAEAEQSQE